MADPIAPPAPVEDVAVDVPVTVSPGVDAARRGDFEAMQASIRAERAGTPLERVTVDADAAPADGQPPAPAEKPRQISRRQAEVNEYERKLAEQALRIADLERRVTPAAPQAPVAPEPTLAKTTPAYKRYAALPNAPKLADVGPDGQPVYETVEEHSAAMALFIAEQRELDAHQTRTFDAQRARFDQQAQSFNTRLAATAAADPDFQSKIAPQVLTAKPVIALQPGERATVANVVAQAIWDGADPARLLPHLHADGDKALVEITKLPQDQWLTALHRLDGRLAAGATSPALSPPAPAAVAGPRPSPISAAPPPPPKVNGAGSTANPADTALARGDVGFFIRQEQEKRAAGRRTA